MILLYKMVKAIEVHVGKNLADQISDGQPAPSLTGREETSSGSPDLQRTLLPALGGFHQQLQHLHHLFAKPLAQNIPLVLRKTFHPSQHSLRVVTPFQELNREIRRRASKHSILQKKISARLAVPFFRCLAGILFLRQPG